MSLKENDVWVEAAQETFEEALANGNYALAMGVIEDCRDNGFGYIAQEWHNRLLNQSLNKFVVKSPYQN